MRHIYMFLLLIFLSAPAFAGSGPTKLGNFNSWQAYEVKAGTGSMCYMMLRPQLLDYKVPITQATKVKGKTVKKTEIKQGKRSDLYLMITLRPSESMSPVVSYRSGYIFKQGSEVVLKAGPKPYTLFTDKDQAWARSSAMDVAITTALRKAKTAIIQGASSENGKSSDTFNLDGGENAYKAIAKACGIT